MFTVILISGNGQTKLEAKTKREALALIPWTRLATIQKLPGPIWLCKTKT